MILPDVNVLLYAWRTDSPEHAVHRRWLEDGLNSEKAYGMSPQVLASVICVATHPRIYSRPSGLAETQAFALLLLEQPHCHMVQPGPRHWNIFGDLCRRSKALGNLIQDAWFAALAIESGCEWITTDRDYAGFDGLRWRAVV